MSRKRRKLRLAERRPEERFEEVAPAPTSAPADEVAELRLARLASAVGNNAFGQIARAGWGILPDGTAHPDVTQALARARGHGQPLAADVRERVGHALGDSLGDVRIHSDETAGRLTNAVAARAFAVGSDVFVAPSEYRPGSSDGDALLAHELTHVVQQRGAPTSGPLRVSQPDDALEREADSAARAGAAPSLSPAGASIHRFVESEHKMIGDLGSARGPETARMIEIAPGFSVTYGDMVAMSGDHFESVKQITDLAKIPGPGEGTREEVEYVLTVEIHGEKDKKDTFSAGAIHGAEKRYYELASRNQSHFLNPREGDTGRDIHDMVTAHEGGVAMGAAANYHDGHRLALMEAARAGKAHEPIDQALAQEAFSNHFLTDSFSAGHIRTPRQSLSEYWHAKVPMFFVNFEMYMAEQIAKYINDHNWRGWVASVDLIEMGEGGALDLWQTGSYATIQATLRAKGMPEITFGDIVSGALHDYDNVHGVDVTVAGHDMRVLGDGQLVRNGQATPEGQGTLLTAAEAVRTSIAEVEEAYADGGAGGAVGDAAVARFLTRNDGLFAAELMIPQVLPELMQTTRQVQWEFDSASQLLQDAQFKEAAAITAHDKASELQAIGDTLDADYKREAFKDGFLTKLEGGPDDVARTLQEIIDYTPGSGGGLFGHNEDDEAVDYWKEAKRRNALGTLTLPAKQKLIHDVLTGATLGEEDTMIVELLDANHDDGVRIIEHFGWHWIWDDVDGEDCRNFIRRLGPDFWRTQSLDAKSTEVEWLADGSTPDVQQETIVIILRTCTPQEAARLVDRFDLLFDLDGQWDTEVRRMIEGVSRLPVGAGAGAGAEPGGP
jgi:Domain of unknown function (DUF4157)